MKLRTNVAVKEVEFVGSQDASPSKRAMEALQNATKIIIGPSNPITSIGPILSIAGYREMLRRCQSKVIAIAPIIGTKAVSGPTSKLMEAMGFSSSIEGLAKYYENLVGMMILHETDRDQGKALASYGIEVHYSDILLDSQQKKINLAQTILDMI